MKRRSSAVPKAIAMLKAIAKERGLTQEELGFRAGVRQRTVCKVFQNGLARFYTVEAMANALGCEVIVRKKNEG